MTTERTAFEKSCHECGYDRGFEFLRFAIGEAPVDFPLDYRTQNGDFAAGEMVTVDNCEEVWTVVAGDCESNNRQYSPWEFVADAINRHEESEGGWEAYNEGIYEGMEAALSLYREGTNLETRPCLMCGIPWSEEEDSDEEE